MEYEGLLTGSQGEGPQFHWLARLLGYVPLASLLAAANATLLALLSIARLSFPAYRSLAGLANARAWLPSQVFLTIQSWTLRQAHPRAPPIRVAVPRSNLVGNPNASTTLNCWPELTMEQDHMPDP